MPSALRCSTRLSAIALAALGSVASSASAAPPLKAHACATDAKARAAKLLALHTDNDERASVADKVTAIAPVKAARGRGRLDVLEVTGYVDKAHDRMRFLYSQAPGACALVGQEILEFATP